MRNVTWTAVLLVAAGGAVGSVARYAVGVAAGGVAGAGAWWPWGTFVVNVVGSFVLGVLVGATPAGHPARLLLGTGFCGGFTTFSTFSTEIIALAEGGAGARAGAYALGSVALGIAAAAAGVAVGRTVGRGA